MRERWRAAGGEGEAGPTEAGTWLVRVRVPALARARDADAVVVA
ncbi:hypothetical protein OVA14_05395 [Agrococcus sp. SL85]|nr:hypothetical protein [Agrococcus sp. SL85]WAC67179.1 hypothetical protein OVA14_05395 [Agrococcus sp. SL85]